LSTYMMSFCSTAAPHTDLPSFPTRRSSDLRWHRPIEVPGAINHQGLPMLLKHLLLQNGDGGGLTATVVSWPGITPKDSNSRIGRSEEHTSELQSLAYLVCRLLLEKKKRFTH